jgi:hypothetical protein
MAPLISGGRHAVAPTTQQEPLGSEPFASPGRHAACTGTARALFRRVESQSCVTQVRFWFSFSHLPSRRKQPISLGKSPGRKHPADPAFYYLHPHQAARSGWADISFTACQRLSG